MSCVKFFFRGLRGCNMGLRAVSFADSFCWGYIYIEV
eukprot:UN15392